MPRLKIVFACLVLAAVLVGCGRDNMFDETGGIRITRSACPAVGVPAYTGDVTLFDPPSSRDARAIDVVATLTKLRGACTEGVDTLNTSATFEVNAIRSNPSGAREVVLPYFATVMRGGTMIVSKQLGRVALRFEAGQVRASTTATANASVSRSAATLPEDVLKQINRKRKPGDADASIDPMSDPAIRSVVSQASFELLVGFQLSSEQLAYNATK